MVERAVNHDDRLVAQHGSLAEGSGYSPRLGKAISKISREGWPGIRSTPGFSALGLKNISKTSPSQRVSLRWVPKDLDLGIGHASRHSRGRHRPRRDRRGFLVRGVLVQNVANWSMTAASFQQGSSSLPSSYRRFGRPAADGLPGGHLGLGLLGEFGAVAISAPGADRRGPADAACGIATAVIRTRTSDRGELPLFMAMSPSVEEATGRNAARDRLASGTAPTSRPCRRAAAPRIVCDPGGATRWSTSRGSFSVECLGGSVERSIGSACAMRKYPSLAVPFERGEAPLQRRPCAVPGSRQSVASLRQGWRGGAAGRDRVGCGWPDRRATAAGSAGGEPRIDVAAGARQAGASRIRSSFCSRELSRSASAVSLGCWSAALGRIRLVVGVHASEPAGDRRFRAETA